MTDSATFMFADRTLRVEGRRDVVGVARSVLRHHEHSGGPEVSAVLAFTEGTSTVAMPQREGLTWTWAVPEDVVRQGPDWFFYYGFARTLHRVWDGLGFTRLHGALLWSEDVGGILVTGERHDGKSSVAAGWLDQGGALATDDTVLVDTAVEPPRAVGVLRELHLDLSLAPVLTRLCGLAESEPYLPGRSRLRYDWVTRFPGQVVRAPVAIDAVVRTRVSACDPTSARRISWPDTAGAVRSAAGDDDGCLGSALDWLAGVPAWEVTWGPDLWSMPGMHLGYLRGLLGPVRR